MHEHMHHPEHYWQFQELNFWKILTSVASPRNCQLGLNLKIILPAFVFAKSMTRSLMPFVAAGFDLLSFNCTLILLLFNF
jgi:hypothetical protein